MKIFIVQDDSLEFILQVKTFLLNVENFISYCFWISLGVVGLSSMNYLNYLIDFRLIFLFFYYSLNFDYSVIFDLSFVANLKFLIFYFIAYGLMLFQRLFSLLHTLLFHAFIIITYFILILLSCCFCFIHIVSDVLLYHLTLSMYVFIYLFNFIQVFD